MMRLKIGLYMIMLISWIFISCQSEPKPVKHNEPAVTVVTKVDGSEKVETLFRQFNLLYTELMSFKGADDFIKFGFGQGGPYHEWLSNVKELENDPDSGLLARKGVVAGELKMLGMEYASSKGQETATTTQIHNNFTSALNMPSVKKVETASGNLNYEEIKTEYELFGKWEIRNEMVKQGYPFEIYKNNDEYIGVIAQGDYKTEKLEKKGNDYYVVGNRHGEYYRIDGNKNLTLFDKDGELASSGFTAVKR